MTTEDPPVRPEAVQAIFEALSAMSPEKTGALGDLDCVTAAEREQAEQLFLAAGLASEDHRKRQAEVWSMLITRQWDQPPSWEQLFHELTPEALKRLGELYEAMPAPARSEHDRRYGRPNLASSPPADS